jgi:hypothetical protein
VKCPGCGAQVGQGVSICPKCDYIVDDSFMNDAAAARGGVASDQTSPGTPLPKPPPARRAAPAPRPAARDEPEPEPDLDPHPNPIASRQTHYSPVFRPEEVEEEAREFFRSLTRADRLAMGGAGAAIACSFFPWQETAAEGELIALQGMGVIATLTALACLAALVARLRKMIPSINPALPWLVQLASAALTVLWCLVFIKLASDPTKVPSAEGNIMVPASRAAIGAYLGLLGGVVSFIGTLTGLRESST